MIPCLMAQPQSALIEAVWDAGKVHSIIQADAASRVGLIQVLAPRPTLIYTQNMSQARPDFLSLSVAERIQLAEDIWDSIAVESPESAALSPLQLQEIQLRLDAHDQDLSSAVSWEQVRAELIQRSH